MTSVCRVLIIAQKIYKGYSRCLLWGIKVYSEWCYRNDTGCSINTKMETQKTEETGKEENMGIKIREFTGDDISGAITIWNQVVEEGTSFPQMEILTEDSGMQFFQEQSYTGIAYDEETGELVGVYILHPNNVGRCGHICNASYAVASHLRGQHIGEKLVLHCISTARDLQFRILQFNAVVKTNGAALALYKKLGFVQLGTIPQGFLLKDGQYEDIIPHYYALTE